MGVFMSGTDTVKKGDRGTSLDASKQCVFMCPGDLSTGTQAALEGSISS